MSVTETKEIVQKEITLNMGPQHPATHGVLRLVLDLQGETVVGCDPRPGYLHRGIEKWMESRTYHQIIPMTDRLEYITCMNNNLGYVVAVEKLAGITVPERAQFIRTLMAELTRLSGHLVWLGTHALDIGAMTVCMYTLRERELILDLTEMVTGARQTVSYVRIGGLRNDVPRDFIDKCREFTEVFPKRLEDYDTLIRENRIWLKRTVGIGVFSAEDAVNYGLTGGTLRGSGVNYDLRKVEPYAAYDKVEFDVPLGKNGDVYDRYIVRINEMRQSNRIIKQCLDMMQPGPITTDDPRYAMPEKTTGYAEHAVPCAPVRVHEQVGPHAQGRSLRGHRSAEGRARVLYRERRQRQAVPHQDPRAIVCACERPSEDGDRTYDGGCYRLHRHDRYRARRV